MLETDVILYSVLIQTLLLVLLLIIMATVRNGKNPCRHGINDGCGVRAMDTFCYAQHQSNGPFKPVCRQYCSRVIADPALDSEYCSDHNLRPDTYALLVSRSDGIKPRTRRTTYAR